MKFQNSSRSNFTGFTPVWISAALAACLCSAALAQSPTTSPDTVSLRTMILEELEESRQEQVATGTSLGVSPDDLLTRSLGGEAFTLACQGADAGDFFSLFDGQGAPIVDLHHLADEIHALRPRNRLDDLEQFPSGRGLDAVIPRRAVLDAALASWKRAHYNEVEEASDLNPAAIALVWRSWCRVGVENEAWLETLLDEVGFPSDSATSELTAAQAFNIFRHARAESSAQHRYVALAHDAFAANELDGVTYALILDTDARKHGRPLPYATFIACRDGTAVVEGDVADPENLNQRRAEIGLWPLEVGLAQAQPICAQSRR